MRSNSNEQRVPNIGGVLKCLTPEQHLRQYVFAPAILKLQLLEMLRFADVHLQKPPVNLTSEILCSGALSAR